MTKLSDRTGSRGAFEPLRYALCFSKPRRLTDVTPWHEHVPFAFA